MPLAILAVLLLALALVALNALPAARRTGWVRAVCIVVLVALAAANVVLLLRRGAQPPHLDLFSVAAACFLIGWFLLHNDGGHETGLLRLLGEAAEALAVGSVAGTLTLLSLPLAGAIGLAGSSASLCLVSVLGGLLALVTLPRRTLFHVGLAAAAWLSIARGMAAISIDTLLPAMLALFMLSGWLFGISSRQAHKGQSAPSPSPATSFPKPV